MYDPKPYIPFSMSAFIDSQRRVRASCHIVEALQNGYPVEEANQLHQKVYRIMGLRESLETRIQFAR